MKISPVDRNPPHGPYKELGAIAKSLRIPHSGAPSLLFQVGEASSRRGPVVVTVGLNIDSGVVRGLTVSVARSGLPSVRLRPETDADKQHKATGLNVEAQTGDSDFDDAVYIETESSNAAMRAMLASGQTRRAVTTLLSAFEQVEIDEQGIRISSKNDRVDIFQASVFRRYLEALLVLAGLPDVGERNAPQRRGRGLVTASVVSLFYAVPAFVFALWAFTPETVWLPLIGLGCGLFPWVLLTGRAREYVRGHARSAEYLGYVRLALFFSIPMLFSAALVGLNGGCDPSPRVVERGKVFALKRFLDDGEPLVRVDVAWDGGERSSQTFDDDAGIYEGAELTRVRRQGLLGFRWIDERARVLID